MPQVAGQRDVQACVGAHLHVLDVLFPAAAPQLIDKALELLQVTLAQAARVRTEASGFYLYLPEFHAYDATVLQTMLADATAHRLHLTFVDESLLALGEIWAAAGTPNAVFKLAPAELVAMTGGRVLAV